MAISGNLGYPRIGENRELKKAVEAYWNNKATLADLTRAGAAIRKTNWLYQKEAGIQRIPSNDFSFYDQMLDMTCLVGNVPPRFSWDGGPIDLNTVFLIARGMREADSSRSVPASEMTKWFDTNYHYIVPEFSSRTKFSLSSSKIFDEFKEALTLGIKTQPVLIGPLTYLMLGKVQDAAQPSFDRFQLLDGLLKVYEEVLKKLAALGAEWVQIDEPVFALDLSDEQKKLFPKAYGRIAKAAPGLKILVASYFGELRDNRDLYLSLPVHALHLDTVRGAAEIDSLLRAFPADKQLSLGVVDGRNIWKNDFSRSLALIEKARQTVGVDRLIVSGSCSLLHSPITLRHEKKLDAELKGWLAFAEEKVLEIAALTKFANGQGDEALYRENQKIQEGRRSSKRIHDPKVKDRALKVREEDMRRRSPYPERAKLQKKKLSLPLLPTTTIGSFPQTKEVRAMRAKFRSGEITPAQYDKFVEQEIAKSVEFQHEIGIDVLVHGEFERNDMVEYFGENLRGFAFTENGWVQSYGSRCVKPPVIFGDVSRPAPMTVRWSSYAQKLTPKPMKGMLTGPITILQWSFVRDDQPRSETAKQIGLAIRDEVVDLEKAGISVIQIDEPAIREGLPLRRSDWQSYLQWAVEAFRLSASGVRDETQIHTHMCYSEFNDIIDSIAALDADVISIETSRSKMELLDAFVNFKYPNEIGPGVYDIHSPRVPTVDEMNELLRKAAKVLQPEKIWVNPDCGLKTRQWEEVIPALKHMVVSAKAMRQELAGVASR
ncbi:MAG: 5-methyltetrahydropteroyltriglutamate--homocysteine S-methyltransferase [Candidatus Omnitrophota bacterium]